MDMFWWRFLKQFFIIYVGKEDSAFNRIELIDPHTFWDMDFLMEKGRSCYLLIRITTQETYSLPPHEKSHTEVLSPDYSVDPMASISSIEFL